MNLTIKVPATSANLGAGFDCLSLALNLHNEIKIHMIPTNNSINIKSIKTQGEEISLDNNLFLKVLTNTLNILYHSLNADLHLEFNNNIPISRGLGSSASIIIAGLIAAFKLTKTRVDEGRLLRLALEYEHHGDNLISALKGGFNVSFIEDGELHFINHQISRQIKAVLFIPTARVSTEHSRDLLPKFIPIENASFNIARSAFIASILSSPNPNYSMLKEANGDKLHQDIRMDKFPVLHEVRKIALEYGALLSVLSGSGSSFLNIVHEEDVPKIAKALRESTNDAEVLTLGFDNLGTIVEENKAN